MMDKIQTSGLLAQADTINQTASHAAAWTPRELLIACVFLVLYLLLDWIDILQAGSSPGITAWNPQIGLAVALLILLGARFIPVFASAVVLAQIFLQHEPVPLVYLLFKSVGLIFVYGLGARLLVRRLHSQARIRSLTDLIWMIVIFTLAPLVIGSVYFGALANAGLTQWSAVPGTLARFWIADVLGILATLPVLLYLATPSGRRQLISALRRWETLIQLTCTLALLVFIFDLSDQGPVRYFFVMFLPLVWIATRQGLLGAGLALFAVMFGLIALVQLETAGGSNLFELQARVLGLGITALVLGVVVDERRRVQQRLQQSMRLAAAGEMAAALAHELNQPLTALVGYGKACQLLLARETMDKLELSRTVDKSAAQAQRIASIVARLRDFLRSGRMNLERVDVGDLILAVRNSIVPMYDVDGVQLSVHVALQLDAVHVDRVEVEIVLRNLLTNAAESILDANAELRSVRIEALPAETGFIRISVIDTGPGISPEIEGRLFSPFATSKSHGMGMGLAVSRAIVEAHGGRLWAEPAAKGIFHMTLPTITGDFDGDSR